MIETEITMTFLSGTLFYLIFAAHPGEHDDPVANAGDLRSPWSPTEVMNILNWEPPYGEKGVEVPAGTHLIGNPWESCSSVYIHVYIYTHYK